MCLNCPTCGTKGVLLYINIYHKSLSGKIGHYKEELTGWLLCKVCKKPFPTGGRVNV